MLTTVSAFREPWEAHMFSARLNAEGIPAFVAHEFHVGIAWYSSVALGGVKVQVPAEHCADARAVERLCVDGAFVPLLEQKFGTLDTVRCPKCGSSEYRKRRPLVRAVAAIAITMGCGPLLPPLGWVYFCEKCGTKYRAPLCPKTARQWLTIALAVASQTFALLAVAACLWLLSDRRARLAVAIVAAIAAAIWVRRWIARLGADPD